MSQTSSPYEAWQEDDWKSFVLTDPEAVDDGLVMVASKWLWVKL
jgi:hypothetical protein